MAEEQTENTQEDVSLEQTDESVEVENDEAEVEEEISEVDALKEQLKACEDKYIRVHAEFENIKKRLEREKYQAIDYASEKFAKDLIPVIDALGMAITSAQTDAEPAELLGKLIEGVELTQKQFETAMDKHDVKEVATDGELDPNIHEAVMRVDSEEHESGHVVQVMQKGYTMKNRTLRAAMVSVAN